jgi:hypothetical protein
MAAAGQDLLKIAKAVGQGIGKIVYPKGIGHAKLYNTGTAKQYDVSKTISDSAAADTANMIDARTDKPKPAETPRSPMIMPSKGNGTIQQAPTSKEQSLVSQYLMYFDVLEAATPPTAKGFATAAHMA